jgi:hypothetical protein
MANPGQDVVNSTVDDMLSDQRQHEIDECITRLARFAPTKVAVEVEPAGGDALNQRYRDYRAGTYALTANESDQLGLRLAAVCDLPAIYPIDWHGAFEWDALATAAQTFDQQDLLNETMAIFQGFGAQFQEQLARSTVRELLVTLNDPAQLAHGQSAYVRLARIGAGDQYAGADLLRDWYERNLKIFANILRMIEQSDERILVLIGAGHAALLGQFLRDLNTCIIAPVASYL